ncbi:hypothetical protein SDC9_169220 [bioreactor metagenome]|uniref:Uncharacterized protein n=1 Tax=bioreactor metagenome TaxID=1076179 RepID=A0A645G4Q1_9ZZZZ
MKKSLFRDAKSQATLVAVVGDYPLVSPRSEKCGEVRYV